MDGKFATGIAVGVGMGDAAVGIALDHLATGVALGIMVGADIGSMANGWS